MRVVKKKRAVRERERDRSCDYVLDARREVPEGGRRIGIDDIPNAGYR